MNVFFNKLIHQKRWAKFLAWTWTLLIFIACFLPAKEIPKLSIPLIDKWVHFLLFAGFAWLWLLVLSPVRGRTCFFVFLVSVLFGFLVELIQGSGISPGRYFDLKDALADAIGGLIGVALFLGFQQIALQKERP